MECMPEFDLQRPTSIAEVIAILAHAPDARILAGGTDLVPGLRRGIERPDLLVDISAVRGIADIAVTDSGTVLGAGVTLATLAADSRIAHGHVALAEAARTVAGPGHRSVGTLGGNLCLDTRCVFYNQSAWWRAANAWCMKRDGEVCHVAPQGKHCHAAFAGDLAPALLALDAEIEIVASRGIRRIPLGELYRDDGAAHLTLARDEVLTRVFLRAMPAGLASGYRKARARGAIDFPLAGVACAIALRGTELTTLRIALTGTNSRPIVLDGTDTFVGKPIDDAMLAALRKLVQKQVSPMRTTVTNADYRRQVAAALAQRLVRELGRRAAARSHYASTLPPTDRPIL